MVIDEAELVSLEEHLLGCPQCVERAEEAAAYVDALSAAMIGGHFALCDQPQPGERSGAQNRKLAYGGGAS